MSHFITILNPIFIEKGYNISVLIHKECWIGLCVYVCLGGKKNVMANEIIGFTYPKPLVILSKLRVKCVIEFGRFCENFGLKGVE
jgi:hypothetical protein